MQKEKMTKEGLLAWILELYAQEEDIFLRALMTYLAEQTDGFTKATRLVFLGNTFAAFCSTIGIEGETANSAEIEEALLSKIGITLHASGSADEVEPEKKRLREYGLRLCVRCFKETSGQENGILISFE